MGLAVEPERLLERLRERPWVGDLLQQRHPLLVLDAVGLHRGDGLPARLVGLGHEHGRRVVEDRLDDREHVQRVGLGVRIDEIERGLGERRQRLIEREVLLQRGGQLEGSAERVRDRAAAPDAGGEQLLGQRFGLRRQAPAAALILVVVLHQRAQGLDRIRGLIDDVEDDRVVHAHPRHERLGSRVAQALERLLGPAHHARPAPSCFWIRRCFFGSSPALATSRAFSIVCSGACTTT